MSNYESQPSFGTVIIVLAVIVCAIIGAAVWVWGPVVTEKWIPAGMGIICLIALIGIVASAFQEVFGSSNSK